MMKFVPVFLATLGIAAGAVAPPRGLECRWAATPPVIDGDLNDAAWKAAQMVDSFESAWLPPKSRKAPTRTQARLLWDENYLYFSAEMEDVDVFSKTTEQDGAIWLGDVFELFFKPSPTNHGYYEFEINAANAKLDMFLPSRGAGGYERHASEGRFHVESVVVVRGTLNKWNDRDQGWTVEGRIPWSDFAPTGGRPAPGAVWRHTLCRYDYSVTLETPALTATAPLARPDFHRYEDYLPLKFVGPAGGAKLERFPWDGSRLAGSPEGPLPYRAVPAFAGLKLQEPITIAAEPGREAFFLLESNGYAKERKSRVARIREGSSAREPLLGLDEAIYDVCFHPRFAENGYFFLGANGRFGPGEHDFNNRLLRYTVEHGTGRVDPASRVVILEWQSNGHNGMAMVFGKDGMLYLTSGDGTSDSDEWNAGQDLSRLLAKVLRIDVDRPAEGKRYSIPKDNPFVGQPGVRPETWAYGLRNPWRMAMDRETGDLWVGENGQDRWESARIVRKGENYGWPVVEGSDRFHPHRKAGPAPITKPIVEHPHSEFRSLTGGIVYRGRKFPGLVGCYIYGDFSTGQIWAAEVREGKLVRKFQVAGTRLGITGFCETRDGEILVIDHPGNAIYQLGPAPQLSAATIFPTRLSQTGIFADTAAMKPHPGLMAYLINAPGWHDGAAMERYVALPASGQMEFSDQRGWNFPDGAVLVQNLRLQGKPVETRLLIRQEGQWSGYTYAWNEEKSDAFLVPKEGVTRNNWRFPSRQECAICHSREANFVIGLNTPQVNRAGIDGRNQIAAWAGEGLIKSNSTLTKLLAKAPEGGRVAALPQSPNPFDESAALSERARAYLHVNCAHCHVRNGGGNSRMQLASYFPEKEMEVIDVPPMHSAFGVADARLVAAGVPERSVMILRSTLRGPGQMPPVGILKTDGPGIALLAKWISELRPTNSTPAEKSTFLTGSGYSPGEAAFLKQGEETYNALCFGCHGVDGRGAKSEDIFLAPPLAGSKIVLGPPGKSILVVLHGLVGPVNGKTYQAQMVPMAYNDDAWIASVLSYIRNSFGNRASLVREEEVARVRASTSSISEPLTVEKLEQLAGESARLGDR